VPINRALCDLGSSVSLMPLSSCEKLELEELRPIIISLQLANHSMKYPMGILEDVLIKVGNLYVPVDFIILGIEEDTRTPIILRRPFLATTGWHIDVKNCTLTFDVGDVHMEFNLLKAAKFPSISGECNKIYLVDGLICETASNINSNGPLEHLMLNNNTIEEENSKVAECVQLLKASPQFRLPLLRWNYYKMKVSPHLMRRKLLR